MSDQTRKKIAQTFRDDGRFSYKVLIEVRGDYLIEKGIVKEWAASRGINPEIIVNGWSDFITLVQAQSLGMLDFMTEE